MSDAGDRFARTAPRVGVVSKWAPRIALAALVLACALAGGSSRADSVTLIVLRPVAIIALVALLMSRRVFGTVGLRVPGILLAVFACLIALQLVPLPPSLWAALPGHEPIAAGAAAAGLETPWRPLSMTPELTFNALLSLIPAAAMLVGLWVLPPASNRWLLVGLLLVAGLSCALGVVQVIGDRSFGYIYAVTSEDLPVGLLANRNHQAAFLAACIPFLAAWAEAPLGASGRRGGSRGAADRGGGQRRRARPQESLGIRPVVAVLAGMMFVIIILMTGSRSGTFLAALAILFVFVQALGRLRVAAGRLKLLAAGGVLLLVALLGVFALSGRAQSLSRFLAADIESDQRFTALPTVLQITRDYLPLGTGYGSFDPMFRIYESDAQLQAVYFNHAHNDLLELAMTGGVPALLVLAAFLLWWGWRSMIAWRGDGGEPSIRLARAASLSILLLMIASLSDYPLRTPLLTLMFALLAGWLGIGTAGRGRRRRKGSAVANGPAAE